MKTSAQEEPRETLLQGAR